jgi:hypothetical protein
MKNISIGNNRNGGMAATGRRNARRINRGIARRHRKRRESQRRASNQYGAAAANSIAGIARRASAAACGGGEQRRGKMTSLAHRRYRQAERTQRQTSKENENGISSMRNSGIRREIAARRKQAANGAAGISENGKQRWQNSASSGEVVAARRGIAA